MEGNKISKQLVDGQRIESIDVLRAFALFGIILVHGVNMFCCGRQDSLAMPIDELLSKLVLLIFQGRAATIFNILFGVSFGIMMGKVNYSPLKFVWRCFLLFLIGLVSKFFYWPDALMWYGIAGMILAPIRKLNPWQIVVLILLLFYVAYSLRKLHLDNVLPPFFVGDITVRYDSNASIGEALALQPDGVLWYVKVMLRSGFFGVVAKFAIGYLLVKIGWIYEMDKRLKALHVVVSFLVYALFYYFVNYLGVEGYWMKTLFNLSGALFYSMMVIWFFEHTMLRSFFGFFASYGKLGLTNYFMQGLVGVLFFCHLGVAFMHFRMLYIILGVIIFYLLQAVFSFYWLKRFRNGPMEYLWRCAIERKRLDFIK